MAVTRTSPFSDPTFLLIFTRFLISFLTVYNINMFGEKNFFPMETHSGQSGLGWSGF